jgi:hypothetical protein
VKLASTVEVQRVRIHETLCGGAFERLQLFDHRLNQFVTAFEQQPRCGMDPTLVKSVNDGSTMEMWLVYNPTTVCPW